MIYEFRLPAVNPHMTGARIECYYAEPGDALKTGAKLLDLGIDLSSAFAQECPPVSFFRVVLRETLILRSLAFARGDFCPVGEIIALFSGERDEDITAPPARGVRFATAGIVHHERLWTGSAV
jgi:hypothetical protein